ncbi:hypothetical protein HDU93_001073 [Gonapodya sp. JEL0774]|nr:hypothetical protein HDU93_001073 [Gonapodya sp. JEL0774]
MSSHWTRLIRFEAVEGGIHFGEPTAESLASDGGLKVNGIIRASEITGGLFEGVVGSNILTVKKLLGPLESTPALPCIGLNYSAHRDEAVASGHQFKFPTYPVLFHKYANALSGPGDVLLPETTNDGQMDFEAELVVVIGKKGKNIPEEKALDHVLAYTAGNDLSARKWQFACGGQFDFGKGMDSFAPIGPMLVRSSVIPDPQNLKISLVLNGKTEQDGNTAQMIFSVKKIVSFLSKGELNDVVHKSTTLLPGTVIMTGTPAGVGFTRNPPLSLKEGDVADVVIGKIGTLRNHIKYVAEDTYEL